MDDDSVSTLGQHTQQKWVAATPNQVPPLLTQRPLAPVTPHDDTSLGSISTLTTRITAMETQYQHISGAVQDIKTMLVGLTQVNNRSTKEGQPTNENDAGQGSSLTGNGS